MSKANQVVIGKLKEMRESGEPVWVTFKGLRLKLRPEQDNDYYEPAMPALFKNRGRLHVALLSGKYARYLYAVMPLAGGPTPPSCSARLQYKCVLAIIEKYHPRIKAKEGANPTPRLSLQTFRVV